MNVIEKIEKAEAARLLESGKTIPDFSAGDTLVVQVRITEGTRSRLQAFEGVCICLLYTSPSPRDATLSRMPSSA